MRATYVLVALIAAGVALWLIAAPAPPKTPVTPSPTPTPAPKKPSCPLCPWKIEVEVEISTIYGQNNQEPTIDLLAMPAGNRKANIESKGLGCCTFRSAEYAAYWQNVPALYGLPEWMKSKGIAGGGTPTKQADMVRRIAQERGLPVPKFVQYEGRSTETIEVALRTGRLPCITWGGNHMLVCVHLDDSRAAIVDNNAPERVQWFDRREFIARWIQGGGGWVFVLLAPPPPPPPAGPKPIQNCTPCRCGCEGKRGPNCRCKVINVPMYPEDGKDVAPKTPPKTPPKIQPKDDPKDKAIVGEIKWEYAGKERWSIDGVQVSRDDVTDALTDDSNKNHLTIIGTPEQRAEVLAQIRDPSHYLVQEYPADHWALGTGHLRSARLYLQDRTGKVLLRSDDAVGIAEKLRRTDPNYKPEADPNGKPTLLPGGMNDLAPYAPWALGGAAAIAALAALRKPATPTATPVVQQPQVYAPQQPTLSATDQAALEIGRRAIADALAKKQL